MAYEPGTVGKLAAQRANRQMAPLRRYLRQHAVAASREALADRGIERDVVKSKSAAKEPHESG